ATAPVEYLPRDGQDWVAASALLATLVSADSSSADSSSADSSSADSSSADTDTDPYQLQPCATEESQCGD
ncbi:MAG: hypothetical protein QOC83_6700, partial [Pseudonocardiales bacterium]|nr:hypothetical protein [Pseudonocardiales bacterium]